MPRTALSDPRSGCPISLALEVWGDPWSLLIVRDLMFKGFRTFNEFLTAGEGIATNILTDRLERLERVHILSKQPDDADGRRFVYRLTSKGVELAPMLLELVLWSAKYHDTDAPASTLKEMRKHRARYLARLRKKLTGSDRDRASSKASVRLRRRP
jgi:DNA-binding HxlR family transcriptional regulator